MQGAANAAAMAVVEEDLGASVTLQPPRLRRLPTDGGPHGVGVPAIPATPSLAPGSVAVVLGTRPEIIKLAGLLRLLGPAARIVYTGQHYDDRLGPAFFREFGLRAPDLSLAVGGTPRGEQIGEAVRRLDRAFAADRPVAVVVQGDTNATLAGALAANAQGIPLIHIEAGLRSYDRAMPEEHNRIVVDHLADLCLAPTETSRANLAAEGIDGPRVIVTGNTVVEALDQMLMPADDRAALLERMGLEPTGFVLATFHRPENVDVRGSLQAILEELGTLPIPVVLPLHLRTAARVTEYGLEDALTRLRVVDPLSYAEFLALAAESALLISDSGGVQEESSVLKRPVVVVRNSTERPEVMGTFACLVKPGPAIGEAARAWLDEGPALYERLTATPSPYGDGTASDRCHEALLDLLA
jgi:UDP-N-acetylglucosamine 2-epimerase (non-hydrolysing)